MFPFLSVFSTNVIRFHLFSFRQKGVVRAITRWIDFVDKQYNNFKRCNWFLFQEWQTYDWFDSILSYWLWYNRCVDRKYLEYDFKKCNVYQDRKKIKLNTKLLRSWTSSQNVSHIVISAVKTFKVNVINIHFFFLHLKRIPVEK